MPCRTLSNSPAELGALRADGDPSSVVSLDDAWLRANPRLLGASQVGLSGAASVFSRVLTVELTPVMLRLGQSAPAGAFGKKG